MFLGKKFSEQKLLNEEMTKIYPDKTWRKKLGHIYESYLQGMLFYRTWWYL